MMDFTILMGSDLINTLPKWREAEKIMEEFDIYVYPRPNIDMTFSTERTTFLADAPQYDYSSTEIREALQQGRNINKMVDGEVLDYIKEKKLWKAEQQ